MAHMPLPGDADPGSPHMPQTAPSQTPIEVPEAAPTMWLRTSSLLVPVPAISTNRAIVMATDFADAASMFLAYPNADDYLLVVTGGGNFMSWGTWTITGMSGTSNRYRTIRFFNVADDWMHPVDRIGGNEVLVDGIQFTGGSSYWMVIGLTNRANVATNDARDAAHHIVWSSHLIEDSMVDYGVRLRGDNCTLQRSLLRRPNPSYGLVGLSIQPYSGALANWRSLDNEISDYADEVLVARNSDSPFDGCYGRSEGNDYYVTSAVYLGGGLASTENAMDFKSGSDTNQTVSYRDRMWGFRKRYPNTSEGDAIEVHRQARYILIQDAFIDDGPFAFFETNWDSPTSAETPRDVEFDGCQFTRISAYAAATGAGSIFRVVNNLNVHDCWFADCDYITYVYGALRAGGPTFNDNVAINTPVNHPLSVSQPYVEADNSEGDAAAQRQYIQCQRWTGGGTTFRVGARLGAALEDREPVSVFSAALTLGTVQIDDTSTDIDGTITGYLTSWGDGTADSTAAEPSHTYAANGIYTITRTITSSTGLTSTTQRNVWVTALPAPVMPRFQTEGTLLETTGGGTPGAPSGCVEGDVLVCWALTQGTEPATFSSANGFEQIPGSPFDVGLASGSALLIALRRVNSSESASDWTPTFNDPGNHLFARVLRYDRVLDTAAILDCIDVIASSIITTASLNVAIPGATTTQPNCLVLGFATTGADSTVAQFSAIATAAPHLENITTRFNDCTDLGNGSGLLMVEGEKALEGAYGGWVATLATTFRQVRVSLALLGAT